MVTLAAGLVVERGAVLVLVAVIAGFASVLLVGSGTLRRMRARRTPSSAR